MLMDALRMAACVLLGALCCVFATGLIVMACARRRRP